MHCVRFGLLICWINAQLPSPFLGSPHTQGVRHASLTGWNNSNFSKDKNKNMLAVRMNSFSNHRLREFLKSYIRFRMYTNKQLNIVDFVCCSNEQLSQFYETRDNIYFSNSIIKQHTTYIIVWQLPISLCHGSNSLKGSEQPYESVQTALSRTAPHICEFFNSFQM